MNASNIVSRFVVTATCLGAVLPVLFAGSVQAAPPTAASPAPAGKTAKKGVVVPPKVKTAARKTGGALATASRKTQAAVGRAVHSSHKKSTSATPAPKPAAKP